MDASIRRVGFLVLLAGIYKCIECIDPSIPFLHAYFEDLIALPLILGIALLTIRRLRERWNNYTIPHRDLLVITLLFCCYFELVLPLLSEHFTADLIDLICYAAGTLLFERWINRAHVTVQPLNTSG